MLDHKAFLSSLSQSERQHLTGKNNYYGLLHLSIFWGATGLLAALILLGPPYWPILMLPLGILLVFNFCLLHETIHKTPFQNTLLCNLIGRIASFIIFQPYDWFRYYHLAHHKFTNIPGKDPELGTPKPETFKDYFVYLTGLQVWQAAAKLLVKNAFGRNTHNYIPERARSRIAWEARFMLIGYAFALIGILNGQIWILKVWLIPLILGQPFLRLYLLSEHGLCPLVENMFENSRTTKTGRIIRFIAWNMPYHAEHHAYPSVPFHKLPVLHQRTAVHLRSVSKGYTDFHRTYQSTLNREIP